MLPPATPAPKLAGLKPMIGRLWLRTFGWQISGGVPPVRKAVVIAAPHTSNWDLTFTLAVSWALGLKIRWIGKHTLFKPPLGVFMRVLGGIPVDRRGRHNAVAATAALFAEHDDLLLIIPPEGTRGKASRWKTGFYYIASEAGVPIIMGFLDYKERMGGLGTLFHPSGNIQTDLGDIRAFYQQVTGKFPALQGEISLTETQAAPSPNQ